MLILLSPLSQGVLLSLPYPSLYFSWFWVRTWNMEAGLLGCVRSVGSWAQTLPWPHAATWRYWSWAGPSSESRVASTSTFCLQSRLYESWCKSVCPKVRTLLHNLNLNRIQDIISTHIKKEQHSLWRLKSISYREGRALTINTFKEGRRALLVQKEEPMKCDALSNQFTDNLNL